MLKIGQMSHHFVRNDSDVVIPWTALASSQSKRVDGTKNGLWSKLGKSRSTYLMNAPNSAVDNFYIPEGLAVIAKFP